MSEFAHQCPKCGASSEQLLGSELTCLSCGTRTKAAFDLCPSCGADPSSDLLEKGPATSFPEEYREIPVDSELPVHRGTTPEVGKKTSSLSSISTVIVTLLAIAIGGGLGRSGMAWLSSELGTRPISRGDYSLAEVEREVSKYDAVGFYSELRQSFPDEYNSMMSEFRTIINDESISDDQVAKASAQLTKSFMIENASYLLFAPDEELVPLIENEYAFISELYDSDPTTCAIFVRGNLDTVLVAAENEEYASKFSSVGMLRLKAIVSGRSDPQHRQEFSEQDWTDFGEEFFAEWLSIEAMTELSQLNDFAEASNDTTCEFGLKMYEYMLSLPIPERTRLYAASASQME